MQKTILAISCTDISKTYEQFMVLKNVTLSLQQGEKVGLVGANGAGKSTLLKILAGIVTPDEGKVTLGKGITIGYIPQTFTGETETTVQNFIEQVAEKSFEEVKPEVLSIFNRLQLQEGLIQKKINELSGGEKTKVALVRILLAKQDLLLLDEPTNNLDLPTLTFLESFVTQSNKTFLIISHDREFLDRTIEKIVEIDDVDRTLHSYAGGFSAYLKERTAQIERDWAEYTDNQEVRNRLETVAEAKNKRADVMKDTPPRDNDKFLRNFKIEHGMRAYQKDAKLLYARLEKMEEIEKPKHTLPLNVQFEIVERSGDKVFELKEVVKNLPHHILGPINLTIQYGERILILGQNGTGKSTFLKLLLAQLLPDAGEVLLGTNLNIGYLPQEEEFDPETTLREEFLRMVDIEEGMGRRTLNRFKLSENDVHKKIKELSSGEKSRLMLAIIMAKKVNCLILDEPSNHIDLEVVDSLEKALAEYKGTLILVSHDRYLINRVQVTKTMLLENGIFRQIPDYTHYKKGNE